MDLLATAAADRAFDNPIVALIALTCMEIVLGIDNIVFIAIVTGRLPVEQQKGARRLGLIMALVSRLLLLGSIFFVMKLDNPFLHLADLDIFGSWIEEEQHQAINNVSIKDLILLAGGLFLIWKSVVEIHQKVEGHDEEEHLSAGAVSLKSVIIQIAMLDIIFSLDSVIAAVGMADQLYVMFTAVIISVCVMLVFAESVSRFVAANPTIKMLALSFLILIGFMLVVEGAGPHFNKGYIYFAMTFALAVEFLNMRMRTVADRKPSKPAEDGG